MKNLLQIVPEHRDILEEHLKIAMKIKRRVIVVAELRCCFSRGMREALTNSCTKDGTLMPQFDRT